MAYDVSSFGFGFDNYGDIGILEIAGMGQAMCERVYCLNGGRVEPVLEHLHYVCFFANSIYMTLQGHSLFFDDFYLSDMDGKIYSPKIVMAWSENENLKLRKFYHNPKVAIKGQPNEFQTGLTRVISKHVFSQEIADVRATVENSLPYIRAKKKAENPLYKRDDEEREFGVRVSRRDMKRYMSEIRKKCGTMEKMGSAELCYAFKNSYANAESDFSPNIATSIDTMLGSSEIDMKSDMTDEELKKELQALKKPIDSGFDLAGYAERA